MEDFITLAGVAIPRKFAGLAFARKYFDCGQWVLATKTGKVITTFPSEGALDTWWVALHEVRRKAPMPLLTGRAPGIIALARSQLRRLPPSLEERFLSRGHQRGSNCQSKREEGAPIKVAGVSISAAHLKIEFAWKFPDGRRWVLATTTFETIAVFPTEAKLDNWWSAFKQYQQKPPKKADKKKKEKKKPQMNQQRQPAPASPSPTAGPPSNPLVVAGALPLTVGTQPARVPQQNPEGNISGVTISAWMADLTQGRKYRKSNVWRLTSVDGRMIAHFQTEEALDAWWAAFQTSRGRAPSPLIRGRTPKGSRNRGTTRGSGSSSAGRNFEDYQQPWSSDYDMPLFDAN